ncbi:MAG: T9SS type A sorting domain-containing protein [Bacteroidetes bacterium]|nr:T9SS type A sorting domain-containing protein [Bacteroidota bacterium]
MIQSIKLFPNPTNGELNLISNNGITKYIVYNLQNEIVLESESELIFNITINLELSKGIYIIKFIDNNNYAFVKDLS